MSSVAPALRSRSSAAYVSGSTLVGAARLGHNITQPGDPFGADLVDTTIACLVAPSSPRQAKDAGWVGIAPEFAQPVAAAS